ncbi:MAG: O-antigen ligase family protein [Bacteroidota bacterium]
MTFLQFNERANFYLTCAIAFLIPAYPSLVAPCIILLALNWISAPKLILSGFKNIYNNTSILILLSLFLFYLIGMFYTENIKFGKEVVETKLSFIAIPLALSTYALSYKEKYKSVLKLFAIGTTVNALVCFIWATYRFYKPVYVILYDVPYNLGTSYFYYHNLSVFMHPSYIALYSVFALVSIYYLVKQRRIKLNLFWISVSILLSIFILLMSSKAGWLCFLIFILYFSFKLLKKQKTKYVLTILGTLVLLFLVLNVYTKHRFLVRLPQWNKIVEAIKGVDSENKKITTSDEGSGSRILVWKAALDVATDNFWVGTGTGDSKDNLLKKYEEKGMNNELKIKMNAHNQFLNTFIALGIGGLLLLLACFLIPLYLSLKSKFYLLSAFLAFSSLNFLFEAMLEMQAGVLFFAFFFTLLCYTFLTKQIKAN